MPFWSSRSIRSTCSTPSPACYANGSPCEPSPATESCGHGLWKERRMNRQAPERSAEAERERNAKKMVTVNRRARHEYEIFDTYEAGLVLVGTEVKSLRAGRVNVQDAFCRIENN